MTLSDPCYVITLGVLRFTELHNITVSFHSPHYFIIFILVVVFYYGLIFLFTLSFGVSIKSGHSGF